MTTRANAVKRVVRHSRRARPSAAALITIEPVTATIAVTTMDPRTSADSKSLT